MSNQPGDGEQTAPKQRRGRGRPFVAGDPRVNRKGRKGPRLALAAAIRRGCDPHELVEQMLAIVNNPKAATRDRIAAFVALADRGWTKPAKQNNVNVTVSTVPPGWSELPPAARMAYLERARIAAALPAGGDEYDDEGEDDDAV